MHFLKLEGKVGRRLLLYVYVVGDFSLPTTEGQPLVWRPCHFIHLDLTTKIHLLYSTSIETLNMAISMEEICKVGQFLEPRVTIFPENDVFKVKHW